MKKYLHLSAIMFFPFISFLPISIFGQCFTANNGQNPSTTQTITNCNGTYQTFATNCVNGQYTKVSVTVGNIYSFKSSKSSDFITISDNNGTAAYASGTGSVSWLATTSTVVRFYTHKNSSCAADTRKKSRQASCSLPPCPSPGAAFASAITETTAVISWNAASPLPVNGYRYEVRTSGAGGSGATGLVNSGTTAAGILTANITGLTPGTAYTPYVGSDCGTSFSSYTTGTPFTTVGTAPNPVPAYSHIVVVIGENTNASSVFGNSNAPYINALANVGAKFTNSFALFHPSQPNYLGLYSGSNQGVTNDNLITTKYTTANLGSELITAGKSYTTYSEGLPSVGYDGSSSGLYVRKHNPAANWMGAGTNQIPVTTNQPFTAFPADYNNLPSVSFVVPDLCNDGHDICAPLNNSVLQYDRWVQTNMDAYKQWAVNNNSLLIVTYDEDDFTSTNKIATVFYGAHVAQGVYSQTINHYTVLRTIEEAFRLTTHAGAAAAAVPINYCWSSTGRINNTAFPIPLRGSENILSFPNPANDKINIVLNGVSNNKIIFWEITGETGVKYKTGSTGPLTKNENIVLPVDYLTNGIYLIRINDGLHSWINKFVIAR